MTDYAPETIARAIHAANRVTQLFDDEPQPSLAWENSPPSVRAWAIAGVEAARNGITPEQSHEAWCIHLRERGWTYGPLKDHAARTHPCLVPWAELTPRQQAKDVLFVAIVRALTPSMAVTS